MRASYGEAAHPSSDWFGGEESQQVHPTAPNGAQNRGTGDWQLIKLYIEMRKGLFFYLETCYVNQQFGQIGPGGRVGYLVELDIVGEF